MVTLIDDLALRYSAVWESISRASPRISALSKSKKASWTPCSKGVAAGAAGGAAAGAFTETTAVAVEEPPGPVAVIVYVVESEGVTFVEPSAVTVPTPGSIESCVASVEFQVRVEDSPLLTVVGLACNVTVGRAGAGAAAGGGGGGVTFLLQPTTSTAEPNNASSPARWDKREAKVIQILLKRLESPCSPQQSHYPNISRLGPGNVSQHDIL